MSDQVCVLIVDDEPALCYVLTMYFEMEGFKVLSAPNGNAAIEIIRAHPEIRFIISDVRMPEGNGLVILKYVKDNCPATMKVITLSGFAENLEDEILKLGALAHFPKPTDPASLIKFVKEHI